VLFISGEDHTPGHTYRVLRYLAAARALGYDADWKAAAPVGPPDLDGASVIVLWRVPHGGHVQGIIDYARERGASVIFDVDDLMFRPEMAVIEIIDGIRSQKFSEMQTQAFFTQIGRTLKACDLVTCPTAELAHHARLMGRPAYVLPNGFDDESHDLARRARLDWAELGDDLLRIGYAGGSRTHQRDFAVAAPAIARVLAENPQARLTLFKDPSSDEGLVLMDEFPQFAALADRIEWRDLVSIGALPAEIARFAVNIAPLEADNPFCEAKSELKFFEAALAGVPTIASPSGPFARAIEEGVTGFLARGEEEWYAALTRLLGDEDLRARMAQAAYHVSLGRFGPQARASAWALMLAQLQGGAAGAAAFERERFRASLPRTMPPVVPPARIVLAKAGAHLADVTVIVPVYNYADFVAEALHSVAAQTLQVLDLVVVDDASPDDALEMVQAWIAAHGARFNRVTLLRHVENAGLGYARNSGFAAAESRFVLPLDADNRLRPAACATLLEHLRAGDAAFAYPAIQQFGGKTALFGAEPFTTLRLQCGNYIDAMALVRKSAWAEAGGYDHVQYGWEDFDFWCRLAERGHFGAPVPELLADYRVHAGSMLHTTTEIQDHKNDLIADLKQRHPWIDVPLKGEYGT
jgi:glycosyltransferase involved in cell wall biosynthesis